MELRDRPILLPGERERPTKRRIRKSRALTVQDSEIVEGRKKLLDTKKAKSSHELEKRRSCLFAALPSSNGPSAGIDTLSQKTPKGVAPAPARSDRSLLQTVQS
ncbi:unnamed protein product [Linum trigynum]|uniref:Uncharacterized protein n=1 Tax=Linum trigynum TaxID=586398 RepID=A0AAV2DT80_9ROSI